MKTLSPFITGLLAVSLLAGCGGRSNNEPVATTLSPDGKLQTAQITVRHGYSPNSIAARAGIPLKLSFYRDEDTDESCDSELEIPARNLHVTLKKRETVTVEIPAQPPGTMPFRCGMDMMKGLITFE